MLGSDLIRWKLVAWLVKAFTRDRAKGIEVYGIYHKGAAGQDSRGEVVHREAGLRAVFKGGR